MKKRVIDGYITIETDKQYIFADYTAALKHLLYVQRVLAMQGQTITTNIWPTSKMLEVKVFLEGLSQPWLPADCKYSWKETTSQEYYNDYRKQAQRSRTVVYHFNY